MSLALSVITAVIESCNACNFLCGRKCSDAPIASVPPVCHLPVGAAGAVAQRYIVHIVAVKAADVRDRVFRIKHNQTITFVGKIIKTQKIILYIDIARSLFVPEKTVIAGFGKIAGTRQFPVIAVNGAGELFKKNEKKSLYNLQYFQNRL